MSPHTAAVVFNSFVGLTAAVSGEMYPAAIHHHCHR